MGFLSGLGNALTGGLLGAANDLRSGIATRNAVARSAGLQLNALDQAGKQQTGAEGQAEDTLNQGFDRAYYTGLGGLGAVEQGYQPYADTGQQGLIGLNDAARAQTPFQAPNQQDIQNQLDPSMKFTMDQGLQALQRSAAGRGRLNAGGTMKDIETFAQGLASTNYGQAYNRAFQTSLANYQSGQENQANQFSRQFALGNMGLGAQSKTNAARENWYTDVMGMGMNTSGRIAQNQLGLGNTLANYDVAGGDVRAAATMGQNSAINGGVSNMLYGLQDAYNNSRKKPQTESLSY